MVRPSTTLPSTSAMTAAAFSGVGKDAWALKRPKLHEASGTSFGSTTQRHEDRKVDSPANDAKLQKTLSRKECQDGLFDQRAWQVSQKNLICLQIGSNGARAL